MSLCPAIFDCNVLAFDKALVFQTLTERSQELRVVAGRPGAEEPNHRHRRLLPASRERPSCRAAEQRHELAAPHGTPPQALPTITTPLRKRVDVADGSIASDYQSKRPRRMSALPPIANRPDASQRTNAKRQ